MTVETVDEFLAHYGVPGMKWGKRKASSSSSETSTPSSDHKKVAQLRTKRPSEMSNEELRTLTNRMNLEQNYARLNPSKVSKGKKYLAAAVGTAGMAISIYNMANSPAAKSAMKVGRNIVYNTQYSMGTIPRAIGS